MSVSRSYTPSLPPVGSELPTFIRWVSDELQRVAQIQNGFELLDKKNPDLAELIQKVDVLQRSVTSVQQDINLLRTDLATIEQGQQAISTDVSTLKTEVQALDSRIAAVEGAGPSTGVHWDDL